MRFVSRYGRFGIQIVPIIQEAYATGMAKVIQQPVYAYFEPGKLRPHERQLAIEHWTFNGLYQEMGEVREVPPDYRIGVFDSEEAQRTNGWSDDTRIMVESVLMDNAESYNNILVVPRTMLEPPWPTYDVFPGTPAELVRKLFEDGHDIDDVLAYELDMQNRPEIVAALERSLEPAKEEIVVA